MLRHLCAIALLVVGNTATLEAQRLVTLNLGGGATLPQGRLGDAADPGWHALAGLSIGSLMQPMGIRVEGAYNRLPTGATIPDVVVTSATLNFTYRLPMTDSPISPYVIAGWGAYWLDCTASDCEADQRLGWNAGLGTKFNLGLRGFLEGRFHGVTGKVRYVPISIGLTL